MDIEQTTRCEICQCYLDSEDLFCSNCGTESPLATTDQTLQPASTQTSFDCDACGASMSYDAAAQGLRCPYCGNTSLTQQTGSRFVSPAAAVPFSIALPAAEAIFRKWLGASFWRPNNLRQAAKLGKAAQVFVPFWAFEARTETLWTADSSPAPPGSRGDYYPVTGQHRSRYSGILVGGSSVLKQGETQSILPFQLSGALPLENIDTHGAVVEQYQVPRKSARPQARAAIESRERNACQKHVPGRARNVKVNVEISSMAGQPVLLPVWILAYRYKSDVHRVLINGQTGKIAGSAPFSYAKLFLVLAILLGLGLVVVAIALAAAV